MDQADDDDDLDERLAKVFEERGWTPRAEAKPQAEAKPRAEAMKSPAPQPVARPAAPAAAPADCVNPSYVRRSCGRMPFT